jgi:hypothetical protein
MILLGYALTPFLDPALKPIFGPQFEVRDHIEKIIIVVVLISISPGIIAWARTKLGKRRLAADEIKTAA